MSQLIPLGVPAMNEQQVFDLQTLINEIGEPQPEHEVEHAFGAGVYVRKLRLKAGTLVVGKMHRHESLLALVAGACTIWAGGWVAHLAAPHSMTSPPRIKRVAYAHTDCEIWSMHATNLTDVSELERWLIVPEAPQVIR